MPRISPLLFRWFSWYSRGYVRRHFHAVRVAKSGLPAAMPGTPLVLVTNHASWWDPLVGLVLKERFFAERALYAPIDAAALARYPLFRRLGFFGVEQEGRRGAVTFLRTSELVLQKPETVLAVTPQGRFADVRERPVRFKGGLGHLAMRVDEAFFLPMAVEYVFWEERLPEVLVRFGDPVLANASTSVGLNAERWSNRLERSLESTMDALAAEAKARRAEDFEVVLRGGAGQGGVYDWWRAARARWNGVAFRREHGTK
jgi:1-acyl-sn-glycerol-3-phosphate acyltransferase